MVVLQWVWHRFRPRAGWLPLLLLVGTVACAVTAVLTVEWVPEDGLLVPAAALGLWMGVGLGQRPLRAWLAWLFISLYGLVWTTIVVANLWPLLSLIRQGWPALRLYWLGQGAIFLDRMGGWATAVLAGNRSQETIAFIFGLGLLTWLLAAYVGWSAGRQQRPLLGLSLMGIAVAVNSYFGAEAISWTAAFMAMAGLTTGVMHYTNLEQTWQKTQVDYSTEIRTELTLYAGAVSLGLLLLALFLPAFSISRLSQFFLQQEAVKQAEAALTRAFAGVRQPDGRGNIPGGSSGPGILPRSYLLGNAPELSETVVMTAVVSPPPPANVTHWRGLSYDLYTGQGWAISEERLEDFAAGEELPLPLVTGQTEFEQSIHWLLDNRVIRYTLGQPLRFNQDVVSAWRGLSDLVRVQSDTGQEYEAISQVTTASARQLRAATGTIPATIQARYTQLPANLPGRIHDLAQEVAGEAATPYEQALALETFLRQYRYSLTVPLPPRNSDPVEFFLFEQQAGYCDYYASAMTVMARSLGLPARMAVGYLAQPPDEAGVQTVRQIHGHSWTEIYFADVGWVEFEPTAAFASPRWAEAESREPITSEPDLELPAIEPVTIPEPDLPFPWGRLVIVGLLAAGVGFWWWQQRQQPATQGVTWAYGRLQQQAPYLGQPLSDSQTPAELEAGLQARLVVFGRYERLRAMIAQAQSHVKTLTELFNGRRYGQAAGGDEVAERVWRGLRRPLWLLRLIQWLKRP